MDATVHDDLEHNDRIYLEKLLLASDAILNLGEDNVIPATLESELAVFRDRVERVLLKLS